MTTENPSVYPHNELNPHDGTIFEQHAGMSLRDYFAGQALAGFAAAPDFVDPKPEIMAREAYLFADAMLAARS